MNIRKGRHARKLAQERMRLRTELISRGESVTDSPPGRLTMHIGAFHGSKCLKTEAERRPAKGGKVHWTPPERP